MFSCAEISVSKILSISGVEMTMPMITARAMRGTASMIVLRRSFSPESPRTSMRSRFEDGYTPHQTRYNAQEPAGDAGDVQRVGGRDRGEPRRRQQDRAHRGLFRECTRQLLQDVGARTSQPGKEVLHSDPFVSARP